MVAALLFGVGCTSHKSSSPSASEHSKATLPPNGRPTAAALAALEKAPLDLTGTGCGGGPLDAGYPTTMVVRPSTCLSDADRSGERAFMSFTGRTGSGGAYEVGYTADGHGGLQIEVVAAGPTGASAPGGMGVPGADARRSSSAWPSDIRAGSCRRSATRRAATDRADGQPPKLRTASACQALSGQPPLPRIVWMRSR